MNTNSTLKTMTVEQLVDRFAELGVAQDEAELYSRITLVNRLYRQMDAIDKELRARGSEARLALTKLFMHPNMQVKVQAAKFSLGVVPEAARNLLEEISISRHYPQAGDAGMSLVNLDRGIFKPD
jgi:hypothetical protein